MINDSLIECKKCSGTGWIDNENGESETTCQKCHGSGEIDWVKNMVGDENERFYPTITRAKRSKGVQISWSDGYKEKHPQIESMNVERFDEDNSCVFTCWVKPYTEDKYKLIKMKLKGG